MSLRRVALCAVLCALPLAGCAKTNQEMAAADGSIVGDGANQTSLHPPGEGDGPLPSDPVAKAPPMPVASLFAPPSPDAKAPVSLAAFSWAPQTTADLAKPKALSADDKAAIARLQTADQGGASAFLQPTITEVSRERVADIGPAPSMAQPYLLDSGDKVRVFVYGQPNLSHIYPIDGAGFIAVPLIGQVKARGLTTYHLAEEIAAQLKVSFVKDPQVSVEIALSRPFFILGEVRAAGQYPFEPGMTVEAAVAVAGGFGPRASEREVRITRRIEGRLNELHVPLTEVVRPGDTIYVEERWF